jgi:hypothetical protein
MFKKKREVWNELEIFQWPISIISGRRILTEPGAVVTSTLVMARASERWA